VIEGGKLCMQLYLLYVTVPADSSMIKLENDYIQIPISWPLY